MGAFLSQDPGLRSMVLNAFTRSISTVWIVMTPIVGVSFIMGECDCTWGSSAFLCRFARIRIANNVIKYSVVCEEVHPVQDGCACWR